MAKTPHISFRSFCLTLLGALTLVSASAAQATSTGGIAAAFEVVVIKPSPPEGRSVMRMIRPLPGGNGYIAKNFPVRLMIALMYKVPARQIEGGPRWLDEEYFDIEAHADGVHSKDELQAMFRTLLTERFGLQMREVSREGKVFSLQLDGTATKMQRNPDGPGMNIPITPVGIGEYQGRGVSMPYLCWFLSQLTQDKERPVIDRTGLTGTFDFMLSFLPEQAANSNDDHLLTELRDRPSLFTALKEQLGLRLVPENGPVQYFVVDHVDWPSAN
ncbi:TIGR03435 family protein [Terriglobus albidus]|uniref:TIGR03435 family protein n=1 Tax=Terriglobus albidus TaxID=1592106 RepID=UPI0021E09441|nr:TIGR03435 family protein [Terriglobus albidus]